MSGPRVGFGRTDFTHVLPQPQPCYGPLEANFLYLEGADSRALIVALDLVQLSREFCKQLRRALGERLGLTDDEVATHCTHSHPTPEEDDLRAVGAEAFADAIAPAARRAMDSAQPALVELVEERVGPRLNICRRKYLPEIDGSFTVWSGFFMQGDRPDAGPIVRERLYRLSGKDVELPALGGPVWYEDPTDDVAQLLVLRSREGTRRALGSVLRFSAHATASGHTSERRWGGDYAYFARAAVERELGGLCVFLNGPCGDLAPVEHCDWTIVRGEPGSPGPFSPKGYPTGEAAAAEAKREGELLAQCVLRSSQLGKKPVALDRISCAVRTVEVPIRETILDSLDSVREAAEEKREVYEHARSGGADLPELKRLGDGYLHYAYMNLVHEKYYYASADEVRAGRFACDLPRIELNDFLIAGFPGEVCQEVTFELRKAIARPVITLTEMNGDAGYMAPASEFPNGDYEVNCSIIDETGLRTLIDAHLM